MININLYTFKTGLHAIQMVIATLLGKIVSVQRWQTVNSTPLMSRAECFEFYISWIKACTIHTVHILCIKSKTCGRHMPNLMLIAKGAQTMSQFAYL